jgi:hypothetical protein
MNGRVSNVVHAPSPLTHLGHTVNYKYEYELNVYH